MLQNLTYPIYKFLHNLLDDSISPDKLKTFLLENYKIILKDNYLDKNKIGHDDIFWLSRIHNNLSALKWIDEVVKYPTTNPSDSYLSENEISTWLTKLHKNRVVGTGGIRPKTGISLISMLESQANHHKEFLQLNIFKLMKYIEVNKRKKVKIFDSFDKRDLWDELTLISVSFSKYSAMNKDIRYLNTALKINDWSFNYYKKLKPNLKIIGFLVALSESELALSKIL